MGISPAGFGLRTTRSAIASASCSSGSFEAPTTSFAWIPGMS